ncbi:MAG: transporter [Verrucomicrobiae bacterium]|jgi:hypothetical protein|nr:transporter [Verrucomicrobiae bacterium]
MFYRRFTVRIMLWSLLIALSSGWLSAAQMGEKVLRELETDRPDATESPVTVDRGRFQLESSFVTFTRDDRDGTRTESLGIMESNIKIGLRDDTDLQLIVTPYQKETSKTGGVETSAADISDLTLRLKHNLWGNDDGATAFGLLPFVKIPSGSAISNGEWEGGLALPFSWRAGERWGLGAQAQVDRVVDEGDGGKDWAFSHTLVLGIDLTSRVGVYLEYLGVAGDHPYNSFFSGGLTYALREHLQLDAGTLIGLNAEAEDLTVFTGFSWKF